MTRCLASCVRPTTRGRHGVAGWRGVSVHWLLALGRPCLLVRRGVRDELPAPRAQPRPARGPGGGPGGPAPRWTFFIGVYGGNESAEGPVHDDSHVPPRFFSWRTDEQLLGFAANA